MMDELGFSNTHVVQRHDLRDCCRQDTSTGSTNPLNPARPALPQVFFA